MAKPTLAGSQTGFQPESVSRFMSRVGPAYGQGRPGCSRNSEGSFVLGQTL